MLCVNNNNIYAIRQLKRKLQKKREEGNTSKECMERNSI